MFYVVDVLDPVILGLPSSELHKLVSIICERLFTDSVARISIIQEIAQYSDQFDLLRVQEAEPHIDRARES